MIETMLPPPTASDFASSQACHEFLYREYSVRVKRICFGFFYDPMEAEDICHEVFINVFQNWVYFRGESHPMHWISCIARNTCITHLRKKKSRASTCSNFHRESDGRPEYGVEHLYEARILLDKTLAKANPVNRSILNWYYQEGWNQMEIAVKLGVSRVAITKAITRVRKQWGARNPVTCNSTPAIPSTISSVSSTRNRNSSELLPMGVP